MTKHFLNYIDHDGEIFDYIRELHEYLWEFTHIVFPYEGGYLRDYLDNSLQNLKHYEKEKK